MSLLSPDHSQLAPPALRHVPSRFEWPPLPAPLAPLVGRETDVATVVGLIRDPGVRLVTLTGPGGVGKTRLALRVASDLATAADAFDGVAFVELASVQDPDHVLPAIVQALGLRGLGNDGAPQVLTTFLRHQRVLLVLDNFEQLVAAALQILDLLGACPNLHLLVTSRTQLRLAGERVVAVPPLSLPGADPTRTDSAAMALFVARARDAGAGFPLTPATAEAVAEICRRLDGLPLAIELAAARSVLFSPVALLVRLEHRLPLLVNGPRDAPARHRTMRDAMAWIYGLLTPDEQAAFRRLAAFAGGATLDAAQAVCAIADALAVIESLVRQSLNQVAAPAGDTGAPRITMLETVREFARELLAGEEDATTRERHAAFYVALVAGAEPAYWGDVPDEYGRAVAVELGNLRAALEWTTFHGQVDAALRLASSMFDPNWMTGDNAREQIAWSQRALALAGGDPANRVIALTSVAWLANAYFDFAEGAALAEEAIQLASAHQDAFGVAWARYVRGHAAFHAGDLAQARAALEASLSDLRALGHRGRAAWALCYLASLDSRDALGEGGDPAALARAAAMCEEALATLRAAGHVRGTARALHGLAYVAWKQRDLPRALTCTREVLSLDWQHGWPAYHYLEDIADIAGRIGRPEAAARLYGAAHAQRELVGRPLEPVYRAEFERDMAVSRRALGDDAFCAAWAAGELLTPAQAVAEALDSGLERGVSGQRVAPDEASPGAALLTRRQAEILPLLVAGQTDREIATTLFLSPRTVEHHVASIAARLGVRSRAAIVGAAHDAGLLPPRATTGGR